MTRIVMAFFSLVIALFIVQTFWVIRERYSETPQLAFEVGKLKESLEREKLRQVLLVEHDAKLRQEIATVLPDLMKKISEKERDYPVRNLASIVLKGDSAKLNDMIAATIFDTGKALFRKGEYERANKFFQRVIENYGFSTQSVEAHFLLAEGRFQIGDLEGSTKTIQQMIEVFPESELTGFGMIRLGQIFEGRGRYDDAVQIYRTVLKAFPYRNVASQAEKSLRQMEP